MKFRYVNFGDHFMPIIPVTLSNGDSSIVTEALVDSGASRCIFDAQFAEVIGIQNIEATGTPMELEGLSGDTVIGYAHDVTLEVGGNRFHKVSIAFSHEMPDNALNILGQQGFFDLFPIKFTLRKREIDLMAGSIHSRK
jgi:hypothetical protein